VRIAHQLWAFVKRDYLLASASRLTLVWQLATVLFAAPTMYYLGRLVQPISSPELQPYGGDYFAFVIVGIAFSGFFSAMMSAWATGIRNEHLGGTLDAVLVSPVSILTVAMGASLWGTLVAGIQTLVYLLVGRAVFHLSFGHMNASGLIVAVLITMIVFASLGMISAALILLLRSGDLLTGVLAGVSLLVAGVFYPTTVLSPALLRVSQWVPLTHTLQALRLALLSGAGVGALWEEMVTLVLFALLLAPVAVFLLHAAVSTARRLGTIVEH
jgi:ABC-2 type transport system permease protein